MLKKRRPNMEDNETKEKLAGKTLQDRAKEIGRDGAYLEVDAKNLIAAVRAGDLDNAKIAVVKFGRMELSDQAHVNQLKKVVETVMARECKGGPGGGELDDDQASFLAVRRIFEKGLASLAAE
jgi:hypothetical protein